MLPPDDPPARFASSFQIVMCDVCAPWDLMQSGLMIILIWCVLCRDFFSLGTGPLGSAIAVPEQNRELTMSFRRGLIPAQAENARSVLRRVSRSP